MLGSLTFWRHDISRLLINQQISGKMSSDSISIFFYLMEESSWWNSLPNSPLMTLPAIKVFVVRVQFLRKCPCVRFYLFHPTVLIFGIDVR